MRVQNTILHTAKDQIYLRDQVFSAVYVYTHTPHLQMDHRGEILDGHRAWLKIRIWPPHLNGGGSTMPSPKKTRIFGERRGGKIIHFFATAARPRNQAFCFSTGFINLFWWFSILINCISQK